MIGSSIWPTGHSVFGFSHSHFSELSVSPSAQVLLQTVAPHVPSSLRICPSSQTEELEDEELLLLLLLDELDELDELDDELEDDELEDEELLLLLLLDELDELDEELDDEEEEDDDDESVQTSPQAFPWPGPQTKVSTPA